MKTPLLTIALLALACGCGKSDDTQSNKATPQDISQAQPRPTSPTSPKAKPTKKTEPALPKEATNPWDTPARLALFLAQRNGPGLDFMFIVPALGKLEDKEKVLTYLKMVLDIAQKTEHPQKKVNILTSVALAQAKAGDKKQAAVTLQQATEVARTIEGARGEAMVLQILATGLVLKGDIKQSLEVAQQMVEASRKGDRRSRIFTPPRVSVAQVLIMAGNIKQATGSGPENDGGGVQGGSFNAHCPGSGRGGG